MAQLAARAQMTGRPPAAFPSEPRVICSGLYCVHLHDKARVYLRPQHRRARLCAWIRLPRQLLAAPRNFPPPIARAPPAWGWGGVAARGGAELGARRSPRLAAGGGSPEGFPEEAAAAAPSRLRVGGRQWGVRKLGASAACRVGLHEGRGNPLAVPRLVTRGNLGALAEGRGLWGPCHRSVPG